MQCTRFQGSLQEGPGMRPNRSSHLFRRALGNHLAAGLAALRPQIDDPVGCLDDVEIVLDHDHAVALVDQAVQHLQE